MSDNRLLINGNRLVRDAFYGIPDFCDPEGNHIGGVYGAFFKLKELTQSGEYNVLNISFKDATGDTTEILDAQIELFKQLLSAKEGLANGSDQAVNDELDSFFEEKIKELSPTGKLLNIPKFKYEISVTSELDEVEALFDAAGEYGRAGIDNFVAYYFVTQKGEEGKSDKTAIGLFLCFSEERVTYIPAVNFITSEYLGQKLARLSQTVSLCTFDIKESYRFFTPSEVLNRTEGYSENDTAYAERPGCFDVLIAAYIINPLKSDYEPWDVCREYLGISMEKPGDVFGKVDIGDISEKELSDYYSKIAYTCFATAPLLRKKLFKTGMEALFYNIEMPLSYILYSMEKEGIIAKKDALKEYGDKLYERIKELESDIYEAAGTTFNINSPKQLGEILFDKLKLPAEKKTKSGYSTAADVLEKLAPDHKIVADILEYRGLTKLKSTYADGLITYIEKDDRIHTSFNQTITATGRISSTEPNLQNIPMRTELGRLIRKVFVPKDGYVFADADYSQIELRILAHMSEDRGLISAYHEGDDIHRITASKVFHVPFEEVTPLQRRNAKAVNFGIVYGMSSFGLSQDLSISVSEAKDYMEKYFETYPGVRDYQNRSITQARSKGYSVTLFGRRRPIPELKAGNFNLRQFGERVAMNAPIQGTAADIMKIAMLNVFFRLKREALKSRLILQIHDELVIETAPDEVENVKEILTKEMERAAELSVPLEVDCHTGNDWYEAK